MRNIKTRTWRTRVLAAAIIAAVPALANDSVPGVSSPKAAVAPAKSQKQVVPSLQGVVFLSTDADLKKDGVSINGIDTAGVKMLNTPAFRNQLSAYLGHPLTFAQLDEITHAVVAYYTKHNHPLVDAVAPAQSVDKGVIQIVVTEFRVGQIKTEGNRWFSDGVITKAIDLHPGDTVDSARLLSQIDAANSNPFRRVDLIYKPGEDQGSADVVLQTQDRFPVQVSTGFDNSGTPVTGRNRWELGVNWGNALWRDQQISYQLSTSTDFFSGGHGSGSASGASFQGHSLTWSMPLRGRDSLSVFGYYDRIVPNVGQDFGMVGLSGQASIRYSLALKRTASLVQTLQAGYDFKTTNNNLQFGGMAVSRTNNEIDQFPVTYAGNLTDRRGSTALTTSVVFSPGDLTGNNNNIAFQPSTGQAGRELASARYIYWRSDATRLTKLPKGSIWSLRLLGQTSTSNLLYTEQLAGGGPEILRGYDPNSVLADRGVVMSNELRSPAFHKTSGETAQWLGSVQLLGFWDWAHMDAVHPVADAVNQLHASSAGVGLRYSLRSNFTARLDFGQQLQHVPGSGNRDHLLNFSIMTSY